MSFFVIINDIGISCVEVVGQFLFNQVDESNGPHEVPYLSGYYLLDFESNNLNLSIQFCFSKDQRIRCCSCGHLKVTKSPHFIVLETFGIKSCCTNSLSYN